jgi:hypothetical protein
LLISHLLVSRLLPILALAPPVVLITAPLLLVLWLMPLALISHILTSVLVLVTTLTFGPFLKLTRR